MPSVPCFDELTKRIAGDLGIGPTDKNKLQRLRSTLQEIYNASRIYITRGVAGAPSNRLGELERIASTTNRLLGALSLGSGRDAADDLQRLVNNHPTTAILSYHLFYLLNPEATKELAVSEDPGTRLWWTDLVHKLGILHEAATTAITELERSKTKGSGRGGPRHQADWARRETAWLLLRLYAEMNHKKPGVSRPPDGGAPRGPAVRFLKECLNAFGWQTTPWVAAKLIETIAKDPDLPWAAVNIPKST